MKRVFIILFLVLFAYGCAEIEPPTPEQVLDKPLGRGPLRVGMTKDEVMAIWGRPDTINETGVSKALGGTKKEEWIYYPKYPDIPVPGGYLSRTKYLYFDGNNLVRFHD